MRVLGLILFLSTLAVTAPLARAGEPVTFLGSTMLAKADLVARGEVLSTRRLGTGVILVSFEVVEVLHGRYIGKMLRILTADAAFFPPSRTPVVLFLKALGEGRFEPAGRVDIAGIEGPGKLAALKAYIEIEAMSDQKKKVLTLRDLLMKNLVSVDRFLVTSAVRELAHFTTSHAGVFTEEQASLIVDRSRLARNPAMKELFRETVRNLRALGLAPEPKAAAVDGGSRVATTLPAPREFRRMKAAWDRGELTAENRLALVMKITAQHLKHAAPVLLDGLSDPDARIRAICALNVGEAEVQKAVDPLVRLLATEKQKEVLSFAIQSLGILKARRALVPILETAEVHGLERAAAFAAARIGNPAAREWLTAYGAEHTGSSDEDREIAKLVGFLLSPAFATQEEALERVRKKRLR